MDFQVQAPDIWLWLGLAIVGCYGTLTVRDQLINICHAVEVHHDDDSPDMLNQKTEDALKLDTLGHLAQNTNEEIKNASIRIITERVLRDGPAWRLMIKDIARSDIERRDKALTCLRFILSTCGDIYAPENTKIEKVVCSKATYEALVNCLCAQLPEAKILERTSPTDAAYRTQPERDALWILGSIQPYHSAEAIQARLISKWLANYPFGGRTASLARRRELMFEIVDNKERYEDDDFDISMRSILSRVMKFAEYKEEMIKHVFEYDEQSLDICHRAFDNADGIIPSLVSGGDALVSEGHVHESRNRRREESFEEQALRRRRREAMVLGENGRPIQSQDIIQRVSGAWEEATADETILLADSPQRRSEARNSTNESWSAWFSRLRPDGLITV